MSRQGHWRAPDAAACCWQHMYTSVHVLPVLLCTACCRRSTAPTQPLVGHSAFLVLFLGVSSKLLVSLQAPAAAAAAPAAAGKETPQERLKRLMQAQLNKAAQKDSLAVAQRKIQVCTGSNRVAVESCCWCRTRCGLGMLAGRGVLFL